MFAKGMVVAPLALAALFVAASAEAQSISRYDPSKSSCTAIQDALQAEGEAILRWDNENGIPLYDRYVANSAYCDPNEHAVPATVPSRDGDCSVKVCMRMESEDCETIRRTASADGLLPYVDWRSQNTQLARFYNRNPCGGITR